MTIEDGELREAFKIASEEHLQKLEDGLLHLEKYASQPEKLNELLREAHSLKGDANMLGLRDIGALTHHLEGILGRVQRGDVSLSPEVSDRLYRGLDAIAQLAREAVTGEPASINPFYTLAYLMGAPSASSSREVPSPPPPDDREVMSLPKIHPEAIEAELITVPVGTQPPSLEKNSPDLQLEPILKTVANGIKESLKSEPPLLVSCSAPNVHPSSGSPVSREEYRIESVRVETQKLDALMTQVGELTVAKNQIEHRLTEIDTLIALWEDWSRDTAINRFAIGHLESQVTSVTTHSLKGTLQGVQNFYQRAEARLEEMGNRLNRLRTAASEDSAKLDALANELEGGIRTLRLLPLSTVFNRFPRTVRDLAKQQSKTVEFIIEGGETRADKRILEAIEDPLKHLIRNAIAHGLETAEERSASGKPPVATLHLRGSQYANYIVIELRDDGRGLNLARIQQTALDRGTIKPEEVANLSPAQIQSLIFSPGFSTAVAANEISGRGVGLDVVRTNVEQLKGTVQVESAPGQGCTFRLQLPTTLVTAPMLILEVAEIAYALPVEFVQTSLLIEPQKIFTLQNQPIAIVNGEPISIVALADLLELEEGLETSLKNGSKPLPCIILKVNQEYFGLLVDAVLDQQDIIIKNQSKLLKRIRNIAGATILSTGEVCAILNPYDLLKSTQRVKSKLGQNVISAESENPLSVLLVEDSITARTQEKRLLESAGYEVITAVDGLDGWNKLKTRHFDAVVTDIRMPNLDGLALTAKIRQSLEYQELPVILVTSLAADSDKKRGVEVGANAYFVKGDLEQKQLLETLNRLI